MNVILNLLPIRQGGGVQVALDFLEQASVYGHKHRWFVVCREGMPFAQYNSGHVSVVRVIKDNVASRLCFEVVGGAPLVRRVAADVVYTLFGTQWYRVSVPQVVGCAYSNLFYPEIDFWGRLPFHRRIVKFAIDHYRRTRLRHSDVRIFETESLAGRCVAQMGLDADTTVSVDPSVSSFVGPSRFHKDTAARCELIPTKPSILCISGYHPNKNIDVLIRSLPYLDSNVHLVLTLPPQDPGTRSLMHLARNLGVHERIVNVGPVPPEGCVELYRRCSVAVLASTLESVSNMIVEAWSMGLPLVITDLEWARGFCGSAASYFELQNEADLAIKVNQVLQKPKLALKLANYGLHRLSQLPTSKERFLRYVSILERATDQSQ